MKARSLAPLPGLCPAFFLLAVIIAPVTSQAIIHMGYSSSDPAITNAPSGAYASSGWQWQGDWGSGNGTLVSPNQILTVNHYGASTFTYNGNSYSQVSAVTNGDLKLVTLDTSVHGDFTSWASFYRGSSEVGSEFTVFGQGRDRGTPVSLSGDPKGWKYGTSGTRRWGTNVFDSTASSVDGPVLVADFDASGGTSYEAHLSTWDSGGGAFIEVGGEWRLAGVNYSVDAFFNTSPTNTGRFMAALHDMGGYYLGSDANGWTIVPDQPLDVPSRLYMLRVSENEAWLDANIVIPEPSSAALLTAVLALATLTVKRRSFQGSRRKKNSFEVSPCDNFTLTDDDHPLVTETIMEKSYQKLLNPVHHVIANALTLGFYAFMAFILRPFTFSPDPLIAQAQACFAAVPVAATFWFAIYMFLVVLMDQLKQRKERVD